MLVFVGSKPVIPPPKVIAAPETIWKLLATPRVVSVPARAAVGKNTSASNRCGRLAIANPSLRLALALLAAI